MRRPGGQKPEASLDFSERELRDALGCFPTGVTVVTTTTPAGPLGITASSFASVSLAPPLVLWSPARRSNRFAAFEAATHFAVHILAAEQQEIAEHFARTGRDFDRIEYEAGLGDVPILADFAARLECRHAAQYDGGDHLIVVGEVLRLSRSPRPPLLYHWGSYHRLTGD